MSGWVYLMGNPSMPGLFKIGMTRDDPWQRARQLSKSSGVPTQFDVIVVARCPDPEGAESDLHERFSEYRLSTRREFFRLGDIINGVAGAVARCGGPHPVLYNDYLFGVDAGPYLRPRQLGWRLNA